MLAPATTSVPASGNCTNTTSPRLSCAKSVMPIRATSPVTRTHSCSAVYFRSSGRFMRGKLAREFGDLAGVDGDEAPGFGVARAFGPHVRDRKLRVREYQRPPVGIQDLHAVDEDRLQVL